jgi:Recombinase
MTAIFDRFAVCGSVRATWLWLREQGLKLPLQTHGLVTGAGDNDINQEITWVEPTYQAVHNVLTHPGYAGAYVYGRTRQHRYLGEDGQPRVRQRRLPRAEWEVLITDHHRGFIDWDTYQANQARIGQNIRPTAHQPGTGAVREGCALLQGLATCGVCGRKLAVVSPLADNEITSSSTPDRRRMRLRRSSVRRWRRGRGGRRSRPVRPR